MMTFVCDSCEDDHEQDVLTPDISRQPLSKDDRELMRRAGHAVQSREVRPVFDQVEAFLEEVFAA
jgi:hypothetical protein